MSTRSRRRTLTRHRLDPASLLFGIVFTLMGSAGFLSGGLPRPSDFGTVLGVMAVTGGLVVVLSLVGGRRVRPEPLTAPPPMPLPTPEQVRAEDQQWLGMAGPLTEAEREVLAALEDEDP